MNLFSKVLDALAARITERVLPTVRDAHIGAVARTVDSVSLRAAKTAVREAQAEAVRGTAAACMSAGMPMDVRIGVDFNGVIGVVEPGEESKFKYVATYRVSA